MLKIYFGLYVIYRSMTIGPDCSNFNENDVIKANDLREHVIKPTLEILAMAEPRIASDSAVELLMGTAAQESDLGYNLVQVGGGPGLGIYSIEPDTHADVLRYLNRPDKGFLRRAVMSLSTDTTDEQLIFNLYYATAIARIRYWYEADPLPDDIRGHAAYWDDHYNANGVTQIEEYMDSYEGFVL